RGQARSGAADHRLQGATRAGPDEQAAPRTAAGLPGPGAGRRQNEGPQELRARRSGQPVPELEIETEREGRPSAVFTTQLLDVVTTAGVLYIVALGLLIVYGVLQLINLAPGP